MCVCVYDSLAGEGLHCTYSERITAQSPKPPTGGQGVTGDSPAHRREHLGCWYGEKQEISLKKASWNEAY